MNKLIKHSWSHKRDVDSPFLLFSFYFSNTDLIYIMKTIHLSMMNKKFDSQYTFDLQHYVSRKSFVSTLHAINQAIDRHPPPGSRFLWLCILWLFWILAAILAHIMRTRFHATHVFIPLLLAVIASTLLWVWGYKRTQYQFENAVLTVCSQLNATENIHGINYRLCKNGLDLAMSEGYRSFGFRSVYALAIELDDRCQPLNQRFSGSYPSDDYVSIPLCSIGQPAPAHFGIPEKEPIFRPTPAYEPPFPIKS
ncbi:hypothetical protein BDF14DRAFT_1800101 [Spinellus fusiger]|nr:hypothetical protein BDF14DRAFT_1800101 [Spinellus fusiger]